MEPGFYINSISHYTKCETAIDYILKDRRLKFSLFSETNDPYERLPYAFTGCNTKNMKLLYEIFQNNNFIKEHVKLLCFAEDDDTNPDIPLFSTGLSYAKPRMWAQYANSKSQDGICLIFNKDLLIEKILSAFSKDKVSVGNVKYLDAIQFAHKVAVATSIQDDILSLESMDKIRYELINRYGWTYFYSKHIDWQDENEFRVILFDDNDEHKYLEIDGCLEAIVMGININNNEIEEVNNLLSAFSYKPKLMQVELWDAYLQLVECAI